MVNRILGNWATEIEFVKFQCLLILQACLCQLDNNWISLPLLSKKKYNNNDWPVYKQNHQLIGRNQDWVMLLYIWNCLFICDYRSEEKKSYLSVKLFPKKPARILRNTLQNLYERIYLTHWSERGKRDVSDSDEALEKTFKIKNKEVTCSVAKYGGPRNFRCLLWKW